MRNINFRMEQKGCNHIQRRKDAVSRAQSVK